eukprot:7381532-Prymnesium_polylepis.1
MGDRASRTSMRCASSPCAMCRSNRRSSLSRCGARRRRRPHVARKHLARRQPDASGHDEPDLVRGESAATRTESLSGELSDSCAFGWWARQPLRAEPEVCERPVRCVGHGRSSIQSPAQARGVR